MAKDLNKIPDQEPEALENSKRIFSQLPLPACLIGDNGIILGVNDEFGRLSGYSANEREGRSFENIFFERNEAVSAMEGAVKKRIELRLIAKNGLSVPVNLFLSGKKEGQKGNIAVLYDMTEAKKSRELLEERVERRTKDLEESRTALMNILEDVEEAKRAAEEEKDRTMALISNFTDGLLFFDKRNRLSLINPKAQSIFCTKAGEVTGKHMASLGEIEKMRPLKEMLGDDIRDVSREEMALNQNLIVEISTISVLKQGEQTGTLVIVHDVTREKMVEKLKTEFVSLSAHQLRTPLSAIKWTLKMFLEGDLGKITEEQKEYLGKTYQSNERMIGLINDLLNVTRIEEGRYLYKLEAADPAVLVQDVVDSLKEQIKNRNIKFTFLKPKKKISEIKADEEKIKLVIYNLLANALAYTPQGRSISIFIEEEGGEVKIGVKDEGIGIPKDQQGRIFTKFFRGANAMKVDTGGSGLGLYISKNIVEAHGGSIWFESEEGKGTTFYFKIPKGGRQGA